MGFFSLLIVYSAIGIYYRRSHGQIEKDVIKHQKREKILISTVGVSLVLAPLSYLVGLVDFASFQLFDWQRVIGGLCALIGLAYFRWAHSALGKNWSLMLELVKDHKLITDGPFKYVRHPMYASIYLIHIGFLVLTDNWLVGILLLAPFTILYIVRVRAEEKMMLEKFGDKYLNYMKRSGRLFPKLL